MHCENCKVDIYHVYSAKATVRNREIPKLKNKERKLTYAVRSGQYVINL